MKVEKLNITRHNYEEFFILYVDNELTVSQRNEVHDFIKQNPDLAEELAVLQQSVLHDDVDTPFENKAVLYRTENGITLSNYEEYFLLYVDDELNSSERQDVEKFVLQHPQLQNDFTLFRSTKLPLEFIEFKNKKTLYRKDKNVRAMSFQWFRVAAAAVLVWVTMLWFKGDLKTALKISESLPPQEESVKPGSTAISEKHKNTPADSQLTAPQEQVVVTVETASLRKTGSNLNKAENKPSFKEPAVNKQTASVIKTRDIAVSTAPIENNKKNFLIEEPQQAIPGLQHAVIAAARPHDNTEVHQVIYREPEDDDSDRSIYIGGAEISKNKLKGIFKKATGIFERKIKKAAGPDNTIQVASFEIKTK